MKAYKKYLNENIAVIAMSDPTPEPKEVTDPNAPILNLYSNGDSFSVTDTGVLYEIIKIFNDIVTKHFYVQNFQYKVNVLDKSLTFNLTSQNDQITAKDFLEGIGGYIEAEILRKFGNVFDIQKTVETVLPGSFNLEGMGKQMMTITVREKPKSNIQKEKKIVEKKEKKENKKDKK